MLFFVIGIFGSMSCLPFRADKHIQRLEFPPDGYIKVISSLRLEGVEFSLKINELRPFRYFFTQHLEEHSRTW